LQTQVLDGERNAYPRDVHWHRKKTGWSKQELYDEYGQRRARTDIIYTRSKRDPGRHVNLLLLRCQWDCMRYDNMNLRFCFWSLMTAP